MDKSVDFKLRWRAGYKRSPMSMFHVIYPPPTPTSKCDGGGGGGGGDQLQLLCYCVLEKALFKMHKIGWTFFVFVRPRWFLFVCMLDAALLVWRLVLCKPDRRVGTH